MERQMDALGRIVLPAGYRKQKNLQAGDVLCVDEQEGKRMIYPRKARCALCGGKNRRAAGRRGRRFPRRQPAGGRLLQRQGAAEDGRAARGG